MSIWQEIISVVVSNGIFATLFVFLFFYQLKDSSKREKAYQNTISQLTEHLEMIEEVKQTVDELKETITKGKRKVAKNEEQI